MLGKHQDSKNRKFFFRDCAIAPKHFPRLRNLSQKIAPSETKNKSGGICVLIVVLTKHHDSKNRIFFPRVRNRQIESAQKKLPNRNRQKKGQIEIAQTKHRKIEPPFKKKAE